MSFPPIRCAGGDEGLRWYARLLGVLLTVGLVAGAAIPAAADGSSAKSCARVQAALTVEPLMTYFLYVQRLAAQCGIQVAVSPGDPLCPGFDAALAVDPSLKDDPMHEIPAQVEMCKLEAKVKPVDTGPIVPHSTQPIQVTPQPITAPGTFQDLSGYGWASTAISTLAKDGIFKGTAPGVFAPAASLTRAEFATLMVRMFHLPVPAQPLAFVDVPSTAWYAKDVEAAAPYMSRFTVPGGTAFEPDININRIEVAATIGAIEIADGNAKHPSASAAAAVWAGFTDGSQVPAGLAQDGAVAVQMGLMKGLPGGTFGVLSALDRAQAAVLLYRVLSTTESMGQTVPGSVYGTTYGSSTQPANYLLP